MSGTSLEHVGVSGTSVDPAGVTGTSVGPAGVSGVPLEDARPRGAPGTRAPVVVRTREELAAARSVLIGTTASVFTLGALHDGHLADMALARAHADHLLVSIFVNPLQFGPGEDLERYPRPFAADLALCRLAGAAVVFAPDVASMYPAGEPQVSVHPGPLGAQLEGASRPGHFAGVLTVVAKLLGLTCCDISVFGEKDYQQLTLARQLVADLEIATQIVAAPVVRAPDGLALSSRNRYLSPGQRTSALSLSAALWAGQRAAAAGAGADAVRRAARTVLSADTGVDVDYLELRGTDLGATPARGAARLLVAGTVGSVRLIDNVPVRLT